MLVNWAYAPRNTIIHRLDPRSRILFAVFAIVAFVVGFAYFRRAKDSFEESL
mgnify:CR=1 FL=1